MAALRALVILAILLAGGCGAGGDGPAWTSSFDLASATQQTRLSVTAWRGSVRLRNSDSGKVEVQARGEAPLPWDKVIASAVTKEGARIVVSDAAKDCALDIEIAAPPGISLSCACADAGVAVSGTWERLEVRTVGGAIDARVERVREGALESGSGAVGLAATAAGPAADLTAKSVSGNVSVTLPAQWNGLLHFATQGGALDVPPHANLLTLWDESKKGVVGRLGPQYEKGAPLPTVWGTSATGDVSFRVGE